MAKDQYNEDDPCMQQSGCWQARIGDGRLLTYHDSVKPMPLDALLQERLLLSSLHCGALVHAHKAQIVQLTLFNEASPGKLMIRGHHQHQLVLCIRDCLKGSNASCQKKLDIKSIEWYSILTI